MESVLTITPSIASATAIASADLPLAVGPAISTASTDIFKSFAKQAHDRLSHYQRYSSPEGTGHSWRGSPHPARFCRQRNGLRDPLAIAGQSLRDGCDVCLTGTGRDFAAWLCPCGRRAGC